MISDTEIAEIRAMFKHHEDDNAMIERLMAERELLVKEHEMGKIVRTYQTEWLDARRAVEEFK